MVILGSGTASDGSMPKCAKAATGGPVVGGEYRRPAWVGEGLDVGERGVGKRRELGGWEFAGGAAIICTVQPRVSYPSPGPRTWQCALDRAAAAAALRCVRVLALLHRPPHAGTQVVARRLAVANQAVVETHETISTWLGTSRPRLEAVARPCEQLCAGSHWTGRWARSTHSLGASVRDADPLPLEVLP